MVNRQARPATVRVSAARLAALEAVAKAGYRNIDYWKREFGDVPLTPSDAAMDRALARLARVEKEDKR